MKRFLIIILAAIALAACTKHEFRTEPITYSKTTILPHSATDSLVMNIEIEYPVDMENQEVLAAIQTDLLRTLLDDEVDVKEGKNAVFDYAQKFEQGYLQAFSSDENDSIGVDCWENFITGRVVRLKDNVMSYCDERYVYLGGPHGINSRHFYHYDLSTGKYMTENDFFKEGYEPVLTQLLIDNLIAQYEEFDSVQDINDSDFRTEDIRPNGNFYFTDYEMVYVFNPYEIAPYYVGETEISIDLNELKDIMKE